MRDVRNEPTVISAPDARALWLREDLPLAIVASVIVNTLIVTIARILINVPPEFAPVLVPNSSS